MQHSSETLIKQLKSLELGGFEAQKIYAPPYRSLLTNEEILAKKPKYAAVNILLYPKNGEWHFPLIHRTYNENDSHSGQISLPGGKKDSSDKNYEETAIRETWEEIGITPSSIQIIKELSPIYVPPSNFMVYTFVSYLSKTPDFNHQQTEVQEVIEVPLSIIKNLANPPKTMELPKSKGYHVPFFEFQGHKIWGATSMILSELSHLLKNV